MFLKTSFTAPFWIPCVLPCRFAHDGSRRLGPQSKMGRLGEPDCANGVHRILHMLSPLSSVHFVATKLTRAVTRLDKEVEYIWVYAISLYITCCKLTTGFTYRKNRSRALPSSTSQLSVATVFLSYLKFVY